MNIIWEVEARRSAAYDGEKCVGVAEIEEEGGRWVMYLSLNRAFLQR